MSDRSPTHVNVLRQAGETAEAREARIAGTYEQALRLIQSGDKAQAAVRTRT